MFFTWVTYLKGWGGVSDSWVSLAAEGKEHWLNTIVQTENTAMAMYTNVWWEGKGHYSMKLSLDILSRQFQTVQTLSIALLRLKSIIKFIKLKFVVYKFNEIKQNACSKVL